MRINKYLAASGIASRRKVEEYILEGKVTLNGKVVVSLSTTIDPKTDIVTFEGRIIKPSSNLVYYALNKPKGYVCSLKDEKGRKTIMELVDSSERIFPIGRLDYNTEGLIFLTNDGDLSHRLMHPSYEIEKTYIANIEGDISESELAVLRAGVVIEGKKLPKARVKKLRYEKGITRLEVTIKEGQNRQIRRMFEGIDKEVVYLKRVSIGNIKLGGLSRKEYRELTPSEVLYLKKV